MELCKALYIAEDKEQAAVFLFWELGHITPKK